MGNKMFTTHAEGEIKKQTYSKRLILTKNNFLIYLFCHSS